MPDMNKRILVAPSILACDFTRLSEEAKAVERAGADWLHLDIMDGHFVPNISFGPVIVEAAKRASGIPLDVHLMIEDPQKYAESFIKAGADCLTVHAEASGLKKPSAVKSFLSDLKRQNIKAGLSLRPGTPVESLKPYLEYLDLILVMTVEPGFGGQAFLNDTVEKIRKCREWFSGYVEVDGGINEETAKISREAGADVLVAGTYIFKNPDYKKAIESLKS